MNDNSSAVCRDSTSEESVTKFMFPEKAVAKRRSSIFTRRSSVAFLENEASCCLTSNDSAEGSQLDLEAYAEILRNEINDWKVMYKQRREIRKKTSKEFRSRFIVNEGLFDGLTEEDKKFLADRPDYCRTGRDAVSALEKLVMTVNRTREIEQSVSCLVKCVQLAESGIKERIVDESMIQ